MLTVSDLMDMLRAGTQHLAKMSREMEAPFCPTAEEWTSPTADPRRIHNAYIRALITCYASKFAQLSDAILRSVKNEQYLIYALAGRSLIETTATLRYYVEQKYRPLMDKPSLSGDQFKELIEIDDCHLRGGRFDWDAFFLRRYSELRESAIKELEGKKKGAKGQPPKLVGESIPWQINVQTCIDKWADVTPEVLIAYSLFCDLVHPNMGSTYLVASTSKDALYFSPYKGRSVGRSIFEQSFPILLSVTHKPFGDYLAMLMGTIWQDDELADKGTGSLESV